ncbi:MAG TPA: ribosome small subunit-dependent GTPase A, partial [Planctomycetaceae bacterium]|nr:ribosome small subunit-dependent GTPase A [Planctomycetaceae bacterium]
INKVDLIDVAALQPLVGLYAQLGYDVVLTSAVSGAGLDRLRMLLQGRQTVFAGQSGVGKSALLNAIQPGLELKVGEVSEWSRKGRHTTRRAELLPLDFGGWIVDTPGIRQMELWDVLPEEVEGFFVEFRPFVPKCKFPDCSHTHESDCGVKRAVAHGLISPCRYESYCRILQDELEQDET